MKNVDVNTIICCPFCKDFLKKMSRSKYYCKHHGEFPIIDDVPCFMDTNLEEFNLHWKEKADQHIPESKLITANSFLSPFFTQKDERKDWLCLDAGCGDGVHISVLNDKESSFNIVGLDISIEALSLAKKKAKKDQSVFVQGDICNLPFVGNLFDCAFSYGVIAYTENPQKAFRELCRIVRPGGLIGLWVLPKPEGVLGKLFLLTRWVCKIMGPFLTARFADLIVPFLGVLPTSSRINLFNASWKQCREVVLVNIAPSVLYFPTRIEVEGWFKNNKIEVIWKDPACPLTIWGRKEER